MRGLVTLVALTGTLLSLWYVALALMPFTMIGVIDSLPVELLNSPVGEVMLIGGSRAWIVLGATALLWWIRSRIR